MVLNAEQLNKFILDNVHPVLSDAVVGNRHKGDLINALSEELNTALSRFERGILRSMFMELRSRLKLFLHSKGYSPDAITFSNDGNILYYGSDRVFEPLSNEESIPEMYERFCRDKEVIYKRAVDHIEYNLQLANKLEQQVIIPMYNNLLIKKFESSWLFKNKIKYAETKIIFNPELGVRVFFENIGYGKKRLMVYDGLVTALKEFNFNEKITLEDIENSSFYREVCNRMKGNLADVQYQVKDYFKGYLSSTMSKGTWIAVEDVAHEVFKYKGNTLTASASLLEKSTSELENMFDNLSNQAQQLKRHCDFFGQSVFKMFEICPRQWHENPTNEPFSLTEGWLADDMTEAERFLFENTLLSHKLLVDGNLIIPRFVTEDVYVSPRYYYRRLFEYTLPVVIDGYKVRDDEYVVFKARKGGKTKVTTFKKVRGTESWVTLSSNQQAKAFRKFRKLNPRTKQV